MCSAHCSNRYSTISETPSLPLRMPPGRPDLPTNRSSISTTMGSSDCQVSSADDGSTLFLVASKFSFSSPVPSSVAVTEGGECDPRRFRTASFRFNFMASAAAVAFDASVATASEGKRRSSSDNTGGGQSQITAMWRRDSEEREEEEEEEEKEEEDSAKASCHRLK